MDALRNPDDKAMFTYRRGKNGEILAEERDEVPVDQEDGLRRWRWEMEMRFVGGRDDDFDYETVDGDDRLDDRIGEERDAEEQWFDGESPNFVIGEDEIKKKRSKELEGETGIQDF